MQVPVGMRMKENILATSAYELKILLNITKNIKKWIWEIKEGTSTS